MAVWLMVAKGIYNLERSGWGLWGGVGGGVGTEGRPVAEAFARLKGTAFPGPTGKSEAGSGRLKTSWSSVEARPAGFAEHLPHTACVLPLASELEDLTTASWRANPDCATEGLEKGGACPLRSP